MNSFNLKWHGDAYKRAVDGSVVKVVSENAERVLQQAKAICPVEKVGRDAPGWQKRIPGSLKKSGRTASFNKNDIIGSYVKFGGRGHMVNGVDTYYAPFVDLGTPGTKTKVGKTRAAIKATPFLRGPFKRNKRKYSNEVKAVL